MKQISTLFILLTITVAVCAQPGTNKEPFTTRSLSTESIKNAVIKTSGGSITVTGVAASEARISRSVSLLQARLVHLGMVTAPHPG